MKKLTVIFIVLIQILFASNLLEPDLDIFFDENATSKQIDAGLDKILDFLSQNPHRVNDKYGEFDDRIFSPFIYNVKIIKTGKFDFERIEKVLKFKPGLNYKFMIFTPLDAVIALGINPNSKYKFDQKEAIRLIDLLMANGADIGSPELLRTACNAEAFEIFSHLLSKGARGDKETILCVAGGIAIFMGQNGAPPIANAPLDPKIRQFTKTAKFAEFYRDKMRYLEELLKFKPLSEFEAKELEIFTKLAAILDSEDMVKFLLKNGICKQENLQTSCENLKKYTTHYDAKESLKLINEVK
ncbi:hypothetical protein CSHOW_0986 [Campylobacter showae]|uniref:Ankyrin repeat protein n=1 Tax=Campylobacter showae RM3277 TaxID=553219 RepID=C6RF53_9BACT|nr:hypothetical protein [Campylobacter showae]EET79861.1 hypothetical protein CAMSH0001_0358 [Campylobacter showae RM3277]QCD48921.1 hypothetical protein CSHOW_0986 [Campylobacter showae]